MKTRWMMTMIAIAMLVVVGCGCTGNTVSVTRQIQNETAAAAPMPGGAPPQNQTQTVINAASGKLPSLGDLNMPGSVQLPPAPMALPPAAPTALAPQEISPILEERLASIEARIEELRVWLIHTYVKPTVEPRKE